MSFLLRSRNNSGGGGVIVPPSSRIPSGSSPATATAQRSTTGVRSGNQMLLHRQPIPLPRAGQLNQTRKQKQMQMQESQGVISMNEGKDDFEPPSLCIASRRIFYGNLLPNVALSALTIATFSPFKVLADLKVLEQQQRDSQLKLANARQLLEERNQQSTALDTRLGSLTYANGELRAQITQHRESLSVSSRALGSRKLIADRASTAIRNFEKNLKKGLMSSRVNGATLSKIDSFFILLETKANTVARIKTKLKCKMTELESDFVSQTRKDESTRNAVNQQVVRFQEFANQLATIRTESIVCDNDFLASQNMEETTRTQTKTLKAEMVTANHREREEFTSLTSKITDMTKNADMLDHQNALLASELERHLELLNEYQRRSHSFADGIDADATLCACQKQIQNLASTNQTLHKETDTMTSQLVHDTQAIAVKVAESKAIEIAAKELMISEQARATEVAAFKSDLETERRSIIKLEESACELKEARASTAKAHQEALLQCDQEQATTQREIGRLKQLIEQGSSSYESLLSAWHSTEADLLARRARAQASYKLAESLYYGMERKSEDMDCNFEQNLHKELSAIQHDMAAAIQRHEGSVSEVLRRHPMLQSIVSGFVHHSNISYEEHSRAALASLKDDLRNMIRGKRDAMKNAQEGYKNRELRVKRNEKDRRVSRERIESELKLHVSPNVFSRRDEVSTRTQKCANFFNPASQEELSEEETPAQPKSLLSSFSIARALPPKTLLDLTPSYHKHVHWKEDRKREGQEVAPEILVELEPKPSRKLKYYGTSQRGLAALTVPKKSGAKKGSVPGLDSGLHFDPLARSSDVLMTSDPNKGKERKSIRGKLNDPLSRGVRVSNRNPQASSVEQGSAVSELKSHHSASSHNSSKGLWGKNADRCNDICTDLLGSNAINQKKPSSNRNTIHLVPSNKRRHLSVDGNDSVGNAQPRDSAENCSKNSAEPAELLPTARPCKSGRTSFPPSAPTSRSVTSETSRNFSLFKDSHGTKKRKLPISSVSAQTSGLSSSEGVCKMRRRNKSSGSQRTSMTVTDDAYTFAF